MKRVHKTVTILLLCLILCAFDTPRQEQFTARGAIVIDFATGEEIFSFNADAGHAPSSMTKMMAVYLAFEGMAAGRFTADCVVPISQLAYQTSLNIGLTNVPLTLTRQYTVSQLLGVIIVPSASAATLALAEFIGGGSLYAFFQMANDKVDEWGIHAYFQSPMGGALPTFISPRAMAEITRNTILHYPQVLDITGAPSVVFHGRRYNNPVPARYPGMDGYKTGTGATARFNYSATAYRDGIRLVTVVMGCYSHERRFSETVVLLDYGFAVMEERRRVEEMNRERFWNQYMANLIGEVW